ncbi:hypothetical protein EGK_07928 [Macaca mulatta]|uniref:Uncharacterized protein n=1 Tax=Macaca mulatta TaxID=9544 RepID=F6YGB3_MACMU|nr:hypothetical protein EGK_07928 [Macaca mulatta]
MCCVVPRCSIYIVDCTRIKWTHFNGKSQMADLKSRSWDLKRLKSKPPPAVYDLAVTTSHLWQQLGQWAKSRIW